MPTESKRHIVLIEVNDDNRETLYDSLQALVEGDKIDGYFLLCNNGHAIRLDEHREYENSVLTRAIAKLERSYIDALPIKTIRLVPKAKECEAITYNGTNADEIARFVRSCVDKMTDKKKRRVAESTLALLLDSRDQTAAKHGYTWVFKDGGITVFTKLEITREFAEVKQ